MIEELWLIPLGFAAGILGSIIGLGGGIRRYLERYEARTGIKTELRINTTIGRNCFEQDRK